MTIQCYSSFQTIKYERKCRHQSVHTQLLGNLGGLNPQGGQGGLSPLEVKSHVKLLFVQMRAIAQHLADSDYDLVLLQVDRIYLEYQKYQSNLTC